MLISTQKSYVFHYFLSDLQKEIEKAKQDAAEKQNHFLDLQKKANDAQALALETRREADRLAQQAEHPCH
jgi:uncharacterized protein YlxW (UPF0749 family)